MDGGELGDRRTSRYQSAEYDPGTVTVGVVTSKPVLPTMGPLPFEIISSGPIIDCAMAGNDVRDMANAVNADHNEDFIATPRKFTGFMFLDYYESPRRLS
jgi:hypothetical protein